VEWNLSELAHEDQPPLHTVLLAAAKVTAWNEEEDREYVPVEWAEEYVRGIWCYREEQRQTRSWQRLYEIVQWYCEFAKRIPNPLMNELYQLVMSEVKTK